MSRKGLFFPPIQKTSASVLCHFELPDLAVARERWLEQGHQFAKLLASSRIIWNFEGKKEFHHRFHLYQGPFGIMFLGRGANFPTALEGALKLKEISYIHAEGYPAAEMKHGPIALIDENMPVVVIAVHDPVYEKVISNIEEIRARKGRVIAVATEGDENIARLADHVIYVPDISPILSPLLTVVPLQLLAYHIAAIKGCDIDKPRNLAKSVTVE